MSVVVAYSADEFGQAALEHGTAEAVRRSTRLVVVNGTRGDALVDTRYAHDDEVAAMRSRLDAELPPLNDGSVDLATTQVESLRGLIDSGAPTLRCTWGTAAGSALATSVTIVDPADAPRIQDMLAAAGFVCSDNSGGILCTSGNEADFLRGNGWVATSWSASEPEGYTEDIAATLWG